MNNEISVPAVNSEENDLKSLIYISLCYVAGGLVLKFSNHLTGMPVPSEIMEKYWLLASGVSYILGLFGNFLIFVVLLTVTLTVETRDYLGLQVRNNGNLILWGIFIYSVGGVVQSFFKVSLAFKKDSSGKEKAVAIRSVFSSIVFSCVSLIITLSQSAT